MSMKGREIDNNDYVIINPLIKMDVDKKMDVKKYNRIYHREYYRRFLSVKVMCPLCGCSITKEKLQSPSEIKQVHAFERNI